MAELVSYAIAHPDKLTYCTSGARGLTHYSVELFKSRTGITAVHVPFKGGAPAMQELSLSGCRLGKDFLGLLLKRSHRADVGDWTIADAGDAELGETFIRWHAVHNHNIHR